MAKSIVVFAVLHVLFGVEFARAGSMLPRRDPVESAKEIENHVLLYQGLVHYRDRHEVVFDKEHPFFFRLLTETKFMDAVVDRWEAHERRFEYWQPFLWKVLDGYANRPQTPTPHLPPPSEPAPPPPSNPSTKGGGTGGTGGGGGTPQGAVPEPGSLIMLLTGVILAGLGSSRRRPAP